MVSEKFFYKKIKNCPNCINQNVKVFDLYNDFYSFFCFNTLTKIFYYNFNKKVIIKNFGQQIDSQINISNLVFNNPLLFLFNNGSLYLKNKNSIKKKEIFIIEKKVTTNINDITQGLPKVSSLLELNLTKKKFLFNENSVFINTNKINGMLISAFYLEKKKLSDYSFSFVGRTDKHNNLFFTPQNLLLNYFEYYLTKYNIIRSLILSTTKTSLILVKELKKVYLNQNVKINDIHFEVVIQRLFSHITLVDKGDSPFDQGEEITREFYDFMFKVFYNNNLLFPLGFPKLLGISRVTLKDKSFVFSSSFQNTTQLLISCSLKNKKDWVTNIKSSLLLGEKQKMGTSFGINLNTNY